MRVLVVEDDVMLADCLADALLDDGHVVCGIASTVAEATSLARLHHPDIAILDMQIRGGECGSDVADQLKQSGDLGRMGVLYVTGETERVHQEATVGHACLSKPYAMAALTIALEVVHDIALEGSTSRTLPRGLQLLRPAIRARSSEGDPTSDMKRPLKQSDLEYDRFNLKQSCSKV